MPRLEYKDKIILLFSRSDPKIEQNNSPENCCTDKQEQREQKTGVDTPENR